MKVCYVWRSSLNVTKEWYEKVMVPMVMHGEETQGMENGEGHKFNFMVMNCSQSIREVSAWIE